MRAPSVWAHSFQGSILSLDTHLERDANLCVCIAIEHWATLPASVLPLRPTNCNQKMPLTFILGAAQYYIILQPDSQTDPRARVSASSHEPVPPRNIPPDPESWENQAIRANTATHPTSPRVDKISSSRVPLPRDISTNGSRSQEPVPLRHEPVLPSRE